MKFVCRSVDPASRRSAPGTIEGPVADWGNSAPLIVRGIINGRNRADLNMFPPSADGLDTNSWKGDGAVIMRNAILYK